MEAPMLHWLGSMFSYLTGENILFSNNAFGQHLASEMAYNDLVDQTELFQECIKYYANILTPFSSLVEKKIEEFKSLNVPVDEVQSFADRWQVSRLVQKLQRKPDYDRLRHDVGRH
jgi:flavorubredoxin